MNNQRGSIWAWAIGAGIVVFIILWWLFHLHSWIAVLLGVVAALLAVILSAFGGGGSSQAPTARAAEMPQRPAAPVPEPVLTAENDAVISAVSDKLKAEPEVEVTSEPEPDPEPEVSAQSLKSPSPAATKTKRSPVSRTASKPRSGDTRTEPRAKAPAARAAKPATATSTAPAETPAPAPAKPAKPAAAPKVAKPVAAAKPAAAPKTAKPAPVAAPKAAKPAAAAKPAKPAKPDDLKKIKGIGPVIEKVLHGAGVTTFAQIAKWKKADIDKFDEAINGPARIEHEDWVGQAKALAKGEP